MLNNRKLRVKLDKADKWRVVITDTSPLEVPIIVSNDGFYKNLHGMDKKSAHFKKMINALVLEDDGKGYTIPLRYNIVKDSRSVRTLSLLHPKGQAILATFYQKYEELICEYAGRGPFSIRAPKKVGGSFFIPSTMEDKNRYKNATVDMTGLEKLVRNPASYFSYSGYDRLYKFFSSSDHTLLEKKYRYQLSLDISKCFDSIYTHSMAWATKSKKEAKENTFASSFGNNFDKVMQRLNHNETSGICIGPEVSRIFAEIILAKVDQNARQNLERKKHPIRDGIDYECRRYVDNYYVFTNDPAVADLVEHELSIALREYNLHLNTGKREFEKRPFYSKKSLVIDEINKSLSASWEKLFESVFLPGSGKKVLYPRYIYKYRSLFGKFTREVKAACFASELGYDAVANYVIGAVRKKSIDIADGYVYLLSLEDSPVVDVNYRKMFFLLLDVGFYFFTLHPTVASSLRLSHTIVRIAQHLQKYDPEGFDILKEASLRWASQLARSPSLEGLFSKESVIPIELLNILISLQQFGADGQLEHHLISLAKLDRRNLGYFELVVKLFIYGNRPQFSDQRDEIWGIICQRVSSEKSLSKSSEIVHLLLDTLACPYLDRVKRAELLHASWSRMGSNLGSLSVTEAEALVDEIQQQHWFVRWNGVDLLNMIEKKELSGVYA
ncbi:antiviral reverse transcriptase Drt3b [Komagataeibacter europaeus]|uniref:antiviral reverse transcriptase Drt3b n=1 Tax=Komagataeibacter europaeus TaxID=33995 RepID=UPI0015F8562E|nr:antiviral reverse transcriptase Drt3b [Komagataeibacter europaeus]